MMLADLPVPADAVGAVAGLGRDVGADDLADRLLWCVENRETAREHGLVDRYLDGAGTVRIVRTANASSSSGRRTGCTMRVAAITVAVWTTTGVVRLPRSGDEWLRGRKERRNRLATPLRTEHHVRD